MKWSLAATATAALMFLGYSSLPVHGDDIAKALQIREADGVDMPSAPVAFMFRGIDSHLPLTRRLSRAMCPVHVWTGTQTKAEPFDDAFRDWKPEIAESPAQQREINDTHQGRFFIGKYVDANPAVSQSNYMNGASFYVNDPKYDVVSLVHRVISVSGLPYKAMSLSYLQCSDSALLLYKTRDKTVGTLIYRIAIHRIAIDQSISDHEGSVISTLTSSPSGLLDISNGHPVEFEPRKSESMLD